MSRPPTLPGFRAPFPYPGGKRRAAPLVWEALGDVRHYVEPFFGSGAVLLSRPSVPAIETVNDLDGLLVHFWRALQFCPNETATHADYPVSEIDLHARHSELVRRAREVRAKLEEDPRWCDPELAGWWVWGASQWIGGAWCGDRAVTKRSDSRIVTAKRKPNTQSIGTGVHARSVTRQIPAIRADGGSGVVGERVRRQLPQISGNGGAGVSGPTTTDVRGWFAQLAARLRATRIVCGDFSRVLTPAVLYATSGITGVFFDPPYDSAVRSPDLYAHDDGNTAARVRDWCAKNGSDPRLRIVLAGLEGEHCSLAEHGWRVVPWLAHGGMARRENNDNRKRERLWLSPHCEQQQQLRLFDGAPK